MMTGRDDLDRLMDEMGKMDVRPDPARRERDISRAREEISRTGQGIPAPDRHTIEPSAGGERKSDKGAIEKMACTIRKIMAYGGAGVAVASVATVVVFNTDMAGPPGNDAMTPPMSEDSSGNGQGAPSSGKNGSGDVVLRQEPGLAQKAIEKSRKNGKTDAPADSELGDPQTRAKPDARRKNAPQGIAQTEAMTAPVSADSVSARTAVVNPSLPVESRDRFPDSEESPVKAVSEKPVSTFSVDVDTVSYSTTRRWLEQGRFPDPDTVRTEEMINNFYYGWSGPGDSPDPFRASVANFETPWNDATEIVRIGIQGQKPLVDERPPLDLVFLVDTSGSMRSPGKLGLLKKSFAMMLSELRPQDRVGIVTYAGNAGTALDLTQASEAASIRNALEDLSAGGSTAGAAGLRAAYGMLEEGDAEKGATNDTEKDADRVGRVLLATDGDFNVGMSGTDEMKDFIAEKRDTGAYLSVLGFGQGNYNDTLMQTLAQNGNGQAAYIDTLSEARKVLVDQLAGNLFTIAEDVKIQVEFNPEAVSEYRLIGYETRALAREDFANDKVDAGEIGAGHQVTALYEVTPPDSDARRLPDLRYREKSDGGGAAEGADMHADELGFLRLRYKDPGTDSSKLIEAPISREREDPGVDDRFATAIAGFGQLLKKSDYIEGWSLSDAVDLARRGLGDDPFGYRAEAIRLMELAEAMPR